MKPTTLIIGSTGHLGTNLSLLLKSRGAEVLTPARSELDFSDRKNLKKYLIKLQPSVIFHLIGISPQESREKLIEIFINSTDSLLAVLSELNSLTTVVIPGSAAEYGRPPADVVMTGEEVVPSPVSTYGEIKLRQTQLALKYAKEGLPVVIGRIFNVISRDAPIGSAIGSFLNQLHAIKQGSRNPVLATRGLEAVRDYLDVSDVCLALLALAKHAKPGEIYNVCSGKGIKMRDLLNLVISYSGMQVTVAENSLSTFTEIDTSIGSNQKIVNETGWQPLVPLDIAVSKLF